MEYIVAIVAISCASGLLKKWMDRNPSSEPDKKSFNRLARAFVEHKKKMTERVQHLEAIIADDEERDSDFSQIEAPQDNSNLSNDLKSKKTIQL